MTYLFATETARELYSVALGKDTTLMQGKVFFQQLSAKSKQ
jgi:hypothetical protein